MGGTLTNGIIKNRIQILRTGDPQLLTPVLDIIEGTLEELNSYRRLLSSITCENSILRIGDKSWDLRQKKNVYLICGGKAANACAMALEQILGSNLTCGVAVVKRIEPADVYHRCQVFQGGHPLPNAEGLRACQTILKLVDSAGPDDLFVSAISGGTSALMSCPIPQISLEEEILVSDVMLKSGAGIHEINAVRRHISQINGGRLAQRIEARGAEMILLMHGDAVGHGPTEPNQLHTASIVGGPMAPDSSTFEDAIQVINNYKLNEKLPRKVVDYFFNRGWPSETPKSLRRHTGFFVNTLPDVCDAAQKVVTRTKFPCHVLTSSLVGSSRDAGRMLASLAKEIRGRNRPFEAPCMLIASGEINTVIEDPRQVRGLGGPGQEMALSFAEQIDGVEGICFASIDTDGSDGPTDALGAIVESNTKRKADARGIHLEPFLRYHASNAALQRLDSIIYSGNTGTALCDLHVLYIR